MPVCWPDGHYLPTDCPGISIKAGLHFAGHFIIILICRRTYRLSMGTGLPIWCKIYLPIAGRYWSSLHAHARAGDDNTHASTRICLGRDLRLPGSVTRCKSAVLYRLMRKVFASAQYLLQRHLVSALFQRAYIRRFYFLSPMHSIRTRHYRFRRMPPRAHRRIMPRINLSLMGTRHGCYRCKEAYLHFMYCNVKDGHSW